MKIEEVNDAVNPSVIHTVAGDGTTAGIKHLTGAQIASQFKSNGSGNKYLVWFGNYTGSELAAMANWNYSVVNSRNTYGRQFSEPVGVSGTNVGYGFLGVLSYGDTSNKTVEYANGTIYPDVRSETFYRVLYKASGSILYVSDHWLYVDEDSTNVFTYGHGVRDSIFTLVPI